MKKSLRKKKHKDFIVLPLKTIISSTGTTAAKPIFGKHFL